MMMIAYLEHHQPRASNLLSTALVQIGCILGQYSAEDIAQRAHAIFSGAAVADQLSITYQSLIRQASDEAKT